MSKSLLDPRFFRQLDRLELQTRRTIGGAIKGDRRSKKKGISIDFADYRQYTRGDDLRFIDWNIYGRLDRLFIKIFHEEQDLQCHILLDCSKSMDFGKPNKMEFARKVAASIGYVGLCNNDAINVMAFQTETAHRFPQARGRHQVRRLMEFLESCQPKGETSLQRVCREFALRPARGIVIVISDFLDPEGYENALRYLIRDSLDVFVLQLLAPQEIEPPLNGHIELKDIENEHTVELSVTPRLRETYKRNVQAFTSKLQDYCTHYGMAYSLIKTDSKIEDLVLKDMRSHGLMKG